VYNQVAGHHREDIDQSPMNPQPAAGDVGTCRHDIINARQIKSQKTIQKWRCFYYNIGLRLSKPVSGCRAGAALNTTGTIRKLPERGYLSCLFGLL
jgi:hypothetical protein